MVSYEGNYLIGAFATREKAEKSCKQAEKIRLAKNQRPFDGVGIQEITLGKNYYDNEPKIERVTI